MPDSNVSSKLRRWVIFRDENETEMRVPGVPGAKAFAKQLIRDGKGFTVRPSEDGSWTFWIMEHNYPNRWEEGA